jgi:hypothetical protein
VIVKALLGATLGWLSASFACDAPLPSATAGIKGDAPRNVLWLCHDDGGLLGQRSFGYDNSPDLWEWQRFNFQHFEMTTSKLVSECRLSHYRFVSLKLRSCPWTTLLQNRFGVRYGQRLFPFFRVAPI